jgi:hypothetical protein
MGPVTAVVTVGLLDRPRREEDRKIMRFPVALTYDV